MIETSSESDRPQFWTNMLIAGSYISFLNNAILSFSWELSTVKFCLPSFNIGLIKINDAEFSQT